jgi:hypothetical protein
MFGVEIKDSLIVIIGLPFAITINLYYYRRPAFATTVARLDSHV